MIPKSISWFMVYTTMLFTRYVVYIQVDNELDAFNRAFPLIELRNFPSKLKTLVKITIEVLTSIWPGPLLPLGDLVTIFTLGFGWVNLWRSSRDLITPLIVVTAVN